MSVGTKMLVRQISPRRDLFGTRFAEGSVGLTSFFVVLCSTKH